jgi:hypothetical protein
MACVLMPVKILMCIMDRLIRAMDVIFAESRLAGSKAEPEPEILGRSPAKLRSTGGTGEFSGELPIEIDEPIREALGADKALRQAEKERQAEEARKTEEARRQAEEERQAEEARKAEEARRQAEKERQAEEARKAEEARRQAEKERQAEEARKIEEARRQAEKERQAEEARKIEEARRQAETERQAEEVRRQAEMTAVRDLRRAEEEWQVEEVQKGLRPGTPSTALIEQYFFTTSTLKLVVMSIFTLNLYHFVWFYTNWQMIRLRTGKSLSPFWRTFFLILWIYPCFEYIRASARELRMGKIYNLLIILAISYTLIEVGIGLTGKSSDEASDIAYFIFSGISTLLLVTVNKMASRVNIKINPRFKPSSKFTVWNWLWLTPLPAFILVISVFDL